MKTQLKITLLLVCCNITIVLLFGAGVYYSLNKYSYIDFYKRLETRASIAAKYNLSPDTLNAESIRVLREQHLEKLNKEKEYLIELGAGRSTEQAAAQYDLPESFLSDILREGRASHKKGNTFFTGITYRLPGHTYLVIVSADNYYASHHLSFLRNILFWGVLLMALIAMYVSIYFSRHIFAPIRHITSEVKQISTENIHQRLQEKENNNEISELILTFNDLLNRIETAFETQKNFISNASHELGTPLTAIIGEADVALMKERRPEEYQQSLQNILKQAERLDQITRSLLFLAQTGYKGKKIAFGTIRTDELIWEVKALIDQLNPQNRIVVNLDLLPEDPWKLKIRGNKELLHLAFANILNNACKYSQNKPVTVFIAASNDQVVVMIKDEGIGIPENEIRFIYDPFFRASNTRLFEGYGIGLPLSRNIIRLHSGTLTVTSVVNAGTTVEIRIPSLLPS